MFRIFLLSSLFACFFLVPNACASSYSDTEAEILGVLDEPINQTINILSSYKEEDLLTQCALIYEGVTDLVDTTYFSKNNQDEDWEKCVRGFLIISIFEQCPDYYREEFSDVLQIKKVCFKDELDTGDEGITHVYNIKENKFYNDQWNIVSNLYDEIDGDKVTLSFVLEYLEDVSTEF
ncbi:MAG: hypothetical protein GY915_08835 [bacterium]|nr:hypothetical protein [bacterium]